MIGQSLNRILVIDDDEGIRTVLEIALGDLGGYTLLLCDSGAEAITQAAAFQPDLIILDSMMPGMDGVATLTALRQVSGVTQTPVVGITAGYADAVLGGLPYVIGMLRKPFYPQTIAREIEVIWNAPASSNGAAISSNQLDLIRQRYYDDLKIHCAELQSLLVQPTPAALEQARVLLHQITGTGTTLGFQRIGAAARRLTQSIQDVEVPGMRPANSSGANSREGFPAALQSFLTAIHEAFDDQPSWTEAPEPASKAHQEQRS